MNFNGGLSSIYLHKIDGCAVKEFHFSFSCRGHCAGGGLISERKDFSFYAIFGLIFFF